MVAKEAKIFDKYALDVDLVSMGASSLILQSMLSGSANLAGFAGPAIVTAYSLAAEREVSRNIQPLRLQQIQHQVFVRRHRVPPLLCE